MPKSIRSLVLKSFARKYEIDLAEAEWPLDQYTSLHEFFTRKLRPGARSVAAESNAVVAPSDGVVCDAGVVSAGKLLEAKGSVFPLSDLLSPPVSVIAQDVHALSGTAAELLFARIGGDSGPMRSITLEPILIPRGSGEIKPQRESS